MPCALRAVRWPQGTTMSEGLTTTDRLVLAMEAEPWSSARELADEVGASIITVCAVLQELCRRGVAMRQKSPRQGPTRRVWLYRLAGEVPEHLL